MEGSYTYFKWFPVASHRDSAPSDTDGVRDVPSRAAVRTRGKCVDEETKESDLTQPPQDDRVHK